MQDARKLGRPSTSVSNAVPSIVRSSLQTLVGGINLRAGIADCSIVVDSLLSV